MYHEKKVQEGKAMLLYNGTFSDSDRGEQVIKSLNEMVNLNLNVSKNRFFNCSINLPFFEDLPDEKFIEIASEYLSEMGYADCPFLIYRHKDKKHHHIHVICTTVNYDGEKVKDFNDQYNSERISRQLERKYDLFRVEKKGLDRKKLSEINSSKYSVSKAICKCFQNARKRNGV